MVKEAEEMKMFGGSIWGEHPKPRKGVVLEMGTIAKVKQAIAERVPDKSKREQLLHEFEDYLNGKILHISKELEQILEEEK